MAHQHKKAHHRHFLLQSLTTPSAADNLGETCGYYPEMSAISETKRETEDANDGISKHHPVWCAHAASKHHCGVSRIVCAFCIKLPPLQTLVLLCSPLQCEKEHSLQISAAHAWLRPVMQLNKNSYWFHSYPLRCTKVNTLDCDYLIEPVLSVREINGATFFFAQSYFVDIKFIWCKFFFKQMWCHLDCYSDKTLVGLADIETFLSVKFLFLCLIANKINIFKDAVLYIWRSILYLLVVTTLFSK